MSSLKSSLFVLMIAVLLAYFYSDQLCSYIPESFQNNWKSYVPHRITDILQKFNSKNKENVKSKKYDEKVLKQNKQNVKPNNEKKKKSKTDSKKPRIFTKAELWEDYRGGKGSKGLYLAFFGKVYDVSKGKQYYAPGGGYDFFAGRDGTKGFVTGNFTDAGLTDDLEGLDPHIFTGFQEWIDFYENTYKFVGYVIGNFYDDQGNPTEALRSAEKLIAVAEEEQDRRKAEQKKFPMCNSESSAAKGSRVWCSKRRIAEPS